MSAPIILASPYQDGARLDPQSYLGQTFGAYRDAIVRAGARYIPDIKASVIAIDRLGALADALREAGFELAVARELGTALESAAAEARETLDAGRARLAEAESRIDGSLYPYQRDGVRWLAPRARALLADEMGLGKTLQALIAAPAGARMLVVAPAAVARNWIAEAARWRPDLRAGSIKGAADWRWPREGEMLVATYGSLPAEDQELEPPPPGVVVVADEAHLLKGGAKVRRVKRWRVVRDAVTAARGRVWLLTGTPLLNRPEELWRVLDAAGLAKEAFGSWPRFVGLVGGRRGSYGTEYGGEISAEVPLALQRVSLRRQRVDVLPDLPRKARQVDRVPVASGSAMRLCDELVALLESHGASVDALADMAQLASSVREVVFAMLSRVRAALAAAKIPSLLEIVEEYEDQETPVVAFSAHLEPLRALSRRDGWALIDGSVSADDRAAAVARFQAGELRGIACSYAAGGVGITLTRAHHVLCVDLPWTPALLQQAEDRCCRIGQGADSVNVRILAADHPVDHRVAELLVAKTRTIEATVEASAVRELGDHQVDARIAAEADALASVATAGAEAAERAERERAEKDARKNAMVEERASRAKGVFGLGGEVHGNFRPPQDEIEIHAARAIVLLAGMDPDHARERNGIGFSQMDNSIGHSFAEALVQYGRLSERQWTVAKKVARKYHRQVGDAPATEKQGESR